MQVFLAPGGQISIVHLPFKINRTSKFPPPKLWTECDVVGKFKKRFATGCGEEKPPTDAPLKGASVGGGTNR